MQNGPLVPVKEAQTLVRLFAAANFAWMCFEQSLHAHAQPNAQY
jgi:hypothetical protein